MVEAMSKPLFQPSTPIATELQIVLAKEGNLMEQTHNANEQQA